MRTHMHVILHKYSIRIKCNTVYISDTVKYSKEDSG